MGTTSSTADTQHIIDLLEFLRFRIDEEEDERQAWPDELAASLALFRTACRRLAVELAAALPGFIRKRILWQLAAPYVGPALPYADHRRALTPPRGAVATA